MTSAARAALRSSLIYTLVGVLWILLSDHALALLVRDVDLLSIAQTWKGWFYIIVTAVLLCIFIHHQLSRGEKEARRLLDLEARYRHFIETVEDYAIYLLDTSGQVVSWNSGAQRLLGYDREEILGRPGSLFFATQVAAFPAPPQVQAPGEAVGTTGAVPDLNPATRECSATRKDGSTFLAAVATTVLRGPAGNLEGYVEIIRDVTERRRAETLLRESAEHVRILNAELEKRVAQRTAELQEKNRELETFTYSVSHDLKAPLRGIDGYSRLLLEDHAARLDDEGRRFLRTICGATAQMNQLIDDLLAYSRLERRAWHQAPVDLRTVLDRLLAERTEDLAALQAATAQESPADIVTLTLTPPVRPVVTDLDGLALALRNLLDNSLKFTRHTPEPRIHITAGFTDTACHITVQDNGPGFDMKFHDRIFEIFQRLHRAEDYPGTGIGLAIVRKAMSRMGGRAWAVSTPGAGATFHLEIPTPG